MDDRIYVIEYRDKGSTKWIPIQFERRSDDAKEALKYYVREENLGTKHRISQYRTVRPLRDYIETYVKEEEELEAEGQEG